MMLRYLGWNEAADLIYKGVARTIANKELTYDLAVMREAIKRPDLKKARAPQDVAQNLEQLIPGARLLGTDGFANAIVAHMDD